MVDQIRKVVFKRNRNSERIEAVAADETAGEFAGRMNLIVKAEVAAYLESTGSATVDWTKLNLKNSLLIPVVTSEGKTYCYLGRGIMAEYDLTMIPAILKAAKGTKLKEYERAIDQYHLVDTFTVNDLNRLEVHYQNDLALNLNVSLRKLQWRTSGQVHDVMTLEDEETPAGLLEALESYGKTGLIDGNYSMYMQTPFGLDKQDLSLGHLSRVFAQDLGL